MNLSAETNEIQIDASDEPERDTPARIACDLDWWNAASIRERTDRIQALIEGKANSHKIQKIRVSK